MYGVDMFYTIKTLLEAGTSKREIARQLGIHRKTVTRIKRQLEEGRSEPAPICRPKKLDPYRDQIKGKLEEGYSAELIHQWLTEQQSVDVSYPTVARFVKQFKTPDVHPPIASGPGEEAQVDFGYLGTFEKDGKMVKTWCFAMTLSHSRYSWWGLATDQSVDTFIRCHIKAFEFFGGAPAMVKLDNLKAGVLQPSFYEPIYQHQYAELLAHYGAGPVATKIYTPEHKGKVESAVKYVKGNFLPPRKEYTYEQLASSLDRWMRQKANPRLHGTTRKHPDKVFQSKEAAALGRLPDRRYEVCDLTTRKVSQLGHVTYRYNYYSVPWTHVGRQFIVRSNRQLVKIYAGQQEVAIHALHEGQGQYISREQHYPPHKRKTSREAYVERMKAVGPHAYQLLLELEKIKPRHWHEMVAGVLGLRKWYESEQINAACRRACHFGALSYREVKTILEKGLYKTYISEGRPQPALGAGGHGHPLALYDQLSHIH
jgi:transposase